MDKLNDFLGQFIEGQFQPSQENLEDLVYLGNGDLESIVSRYTHGECVAWAVSLLLKHSDLKAYAIMSDDVVIHCFVVDEMEHTTFDANGFSTIDQQMSYWGAMASLNNMDDIYLEAVGVEELGFDAVIDAEIIEDTLLNINKWLSLSKQYIKQQFRETLGC